MEEERKGGRERNDLLLSYIHLVLVSSVCFLKNTPITRSTGKEHTSWE